MLLRTRLSLLLTAYLLLLAAGGGSVAILGERANDERRTHDRQREAVTSVERLNSAFLSEAASFRAYLLSGDEANLEDYKSSRADEVRVLRELATRHSSPREVASFTRVARDGDEWRTRVVEPLIALRHTSDVDAVSEGVDDAQSFALFARIQNALDSLVSHFAAEAELSEASTDRARRDSAWLALWLIVLIAAGLAVSAAALHRWVTGPLAAIARLVRDDLSTTSIGSAPPEFARLGEEIAEMRERTTVAFDAAVRAQEGLVQSATVLMSVRSRLESPPELMPPGWSVSASLVPATGVVAGDCYDIGWLRPTQLALVVVDVAGHGAESAVVALRTKELLRASARTYADLGEGMRWVHRQLDGLDPGMFVSAFVATLDTVTGSLEYVCAGHPPTLLCGTDTVVELGGTGPIIGPFAATWRSRKATIEEGQTLVVYTDGLIELRGHDRVEFGLGRLRDLVCGRFDNAAAVIERILDETAAFPAIRGQDDVTLVAVCRSEAD